MFFGIFLIVVGVQLIFVLRELRTALKKVNTIVSGFEKVGIGIEHSYHEVVGFLAGFKGLLKIIDAISHRKNGKHKSEPIREQGKSAGEGQLKQGRKMDYRQAS